MTSPRLVAGPGGGYGNTIHGLLEAVEAGATTVELDVIWLPDAHLPPEERAELVVAHDWEEAESRDVLSLGQALDAFLQPPLDRVEIDLDIKLPGREEDLVAALRERDLIDRAMISTLEDYSLARVRELAPELRRGWSYPKVSRDWRLVRWARLPMIAAVRIMRLQLPGLAAERLPVLGVNAMWVYHPLISKRLGRICAMAGVELIAWKVNDVAEMERLLAIGATGICSSVPALFPAVGRSR